MLAVSSSNHRQRSGRNPADGHAIPGSGLLPMTWQTPTLGFRKQERQLRTGSTGGCLRSIAQRTRSGACLYWIGLGLDGVSGGRYHRVRWLEKQTKHSQVTPKMVPSSLRFKIKNRIYCQTFCAGKMHIDSC